MIQTPLSVLVTGSSGFIGTHTVARLRAAGHRITAIDLRQPDSPLPDGVEFRQCALTKLQGEQWGQIRDRGLKIEDRGLKIEDRGSKIEDRGLKIED